MSARVAALLPLSPSLQTTVCRHMCCYMIILLEPSSAGADSSSTQQVAPWACSSGPQTAASLAKSSAWHVASFHCMEVWQVASHAALQGSLQHASEILGPCSQLGEVQQPSLRGRWRAAASNLREPAALKRQVCACAWLLHHALQAGWTLQQPQVKFSAIAWTTSGSACDRHDALS